MNLGLVIPELQNFYQRGEFYQIIETLQKAQIHAIEIHASFILDKKEKKILELNRALQDRNISIPSVHAPFWEDQDLSSPSLTIRKWTINQHIAVMKQMDILKIPVLTIHPGSRLEKETDRRLREEYFRKSLEIILKTAESLKIKLAVENMLPMRTGDKIETIREIIDGFSSPFLGVCFDTGHANVTGSVSKVFQVIKDKVFDFHVHDNDGTKDMHLQPAYGNIDWSEFFGLVEDIKYQRPLMIEALPWQGRELSWMFKEVKMLMDNRILTRNSPKKHFLRCNRCNHLIYDIESNPICYCSSRASLKNSLDK